MGLVFLSPESDEREVIYPWCLDLHLGGTRSNPLLAHPLAWGWDTYWMLGLLTWLGSHCELVSWQWGLAEKWALLHWMVPRAEWLKTVEIFVSQLKCLKVKGQSVSSFFLRLWGNLFPASLLAAGVGWQCLAFFGLPCIWPCITQVSAFLYLVGSLCSGVSKFPLFVRTLIILMIRIIRTLLSTGSHTWEKENPQDAPDRTPSNPFFLFFFLISKHFNNFSWQKLILNNKTFLLFAALQTKKSSAKLNSQSSHLWSC